MTQDLNPVESGGAAEPARRQVVCPECGARATVVLNRRQSADFCAHCDFPLFWTTQEVVTGDPRETAPDALRRLPGTAGRVTLASVRCPSCAEANTLTADVCVRCGSDMRPPAPPPPPIVEVPKPPEPAPLPPPPPPPSPYRPWMLVVGVLSVFLLVALLVVWLR
jgi:rRNA maturation protein Nop10